MASVKRGWRPALDPNNPHSSTSVHVTLTGPAYDEIYAQAQRDRVTVPEVIRRKLAGDHRDDERDEGE
jgi:hypothetical protein